jgi:Mn2+/Fe2+ NRAMP family transporter
MVRGHGWERLAAVSDVETHAPDEPAPASGDDGGGGGAKWLQLALGVVSAIGGFVDIGDLVANAEAGAKFRYQLLWALLAGVVGIIVWAEMCGRVACASQRGVFDLIRERLGLKIGLLALAAAELVNLVTLAAEIGGLAIAVRLITGVSVTLIVPVAGILILALLWRASFSVLENATSLVGLSMLVAVVGLFALHPRYSELARGFLPGKPDGSGLLYAYFAVAILGATMTPYEVYFFSSGAVEEGWGVEDLGVMRSNAVLGFALGAVLSLALIGISAEVLNPRMVSPDRLEQVVLPIAASLGRVGVGFALLAFCAVLLGATVEVVFSGAYDLAQFLGWEWGKDAARGRAPRFSLAYLVFAVVAILIAWTGVDPVKLTEVSVIGGVVVLPATYIPIYLVANDRVYMGGHVNGRLANALGGFYLVVLVVVAVLAIPLFLLTGGGG